VASGVSKVYRTGAESVEALRDIDLVVDAGQFLAVMGPSGSGKTTLLNCLSGLDEIDEGRIEIDGEDLTAMSDGRRTAHRAKAMGFIFQAFNLIPVFTATENVELPLLLAGAAPRKARVAAQSTLTRVGLGHRLNHRPPELSGGEQQRVTIARALAGQPKIVWADEPTGNLDTETAAQVMGLLEELHHEGLTIILVTHDKEIGATAERRIEVRDGRIVSDERLRVRGGAAGAGGAAAGAARAGGAAARAAGGAARGGGTTDSADGQPTGPGRPPSGADQRPADANPPPPPRAKHRRGGERWRNTGSV
jgi:putative ABC transport system ATP-binding protein